METCVAITGYVLLLSICYWFYRKWTSRFGLGLSANLAAMVWGLLQFEIWYPSCCCSEKSNERLQDEVQRGEAAAEALRRRLSEAEEVSVRALRRLENTSHLTIRCMLCGILIACVDCRADGQGQQN